jgi:hypothetical protein
MSNNSTVKCPKCGNEFEATESMKMELQEKLNKEVAEWKQKKEADFQKQLSDSLGKQKTDLESSIKRSLSIDYDNKVKLLEETNTSFEEKLKKSQAKELEFLKKEAELKSKEAEMEILLQKKLIEERTTLAEQIQKQEQEKIALILKEKDKKMEDQMKLIEEMKKKSEQGSMQLQGEVLELALEEMLRTAFPLDTIEEVAKGVRGADCILFVKNSSGQPCGKIIFESKRTKAFTNEWIEKLKTDMRAQQAELAVIVTEVLPKDMAGFGLKDGVWICRFSEAKALSFILRESLIKINTALVRQENKGEKMQMLYDFLTGTEFRQNMEAVVEGFSSLRRGIVNEKNAMENCGRNVKNNWKRFS